MQARSPVPYGMLTVAERAYYWSVFITERRAVGYAEFADTSPPHTRLDQAAPVTRAHEEWLLRWYCGESLEQIFGSTAWPLLPPAPMLPIPKAVLTSTLPPSIDPFASYQSMERGFGSTKRFYDEESTHKKDGQLGCPHSSWKELALFSSVDQVCVTCGVSKKDVKQ